MAELNSNTHATHDSNMHKPKGQIWGWIFGDFAYKQHADTINGGRGGAAQYAKMPQNATMFQFRRFYLGYNHAISEKFSAELLLAAEDDYNPPFSAATGDLLQNNKLSPFVKYANIRWKNIFKGTDLVAGQMPTPAYPATSEFVWAYRMIERTVSDVYRTPAYDLGVSLQGHVPCLPKLCYNFLVGNGTGAKPEGDGFKWMYGDINYKFFNGRLLIDLYADYEKLNWTPVWHHDRQMNKLFIAYTGPKFTAGIEAFTNRLMGDNISTRINGQKKDTITTQSAAISVFVRGNIYKEKLSFYARYDNFSAGLNNNNSTYKAYSNITSYYDPNVGQQFASAGIDYSPVKDIHIIPNFWANFYQNLSPTNYGTKNSSYDLVFRLTVSCKFGK